MQWTNNNIITSVNGVIGLGFEYILLVKFSS